ncbi:ATP-dependent dethiobiotin synthetase BioD 1 [compost metagenome]
MGGWLAPLSAQLDQLDLVRALRLPVVLVVGLRLGCVNHARLTAQSLQASGVDCVGWIGNHIDPSMQRQDENFGTLQQRLPMPCWGRLPYLPEAGGEALSMYLHDA